MKISKLIVIATFCLLKNSIALSNEHDLQFQYDTESNYVDNVCHQLESIQYPVADMPTVEQKYQLKNCDDRNLYYGIGQPIDYKKARLCAYTPPRNEDTYESAVLAMVYANGLGVKRNYTLAKKAACDLGGAPAEVYGRIKHISELENNNSKEKNFDICDDITSGMMQGICTKIQSDLDDQNREKKLNQITENWSAQQKGSFKQLRSAAKKYFDLTSDKEVDQSGTLGAAMSIAKNSIEKEEFLKTLQKLEALRLPKYTKKDLVISDLELNKTYSKIIHMSEPEFGTIKLKGIKQVQRSWLLYRDAWIEFNQIKYPFITDYSFKTYLTKKRVAMLNELYADLNGS